MNFITAAHMFQDMWQLYKAYAGRKLSDRELETIANETSRLQDKYNRSKLCHDVILAILDEIERTDNWFNQNDE